MKRASCLMMALGAALVMAIWLSLPGPRADAQCGATTSSCKTCHEVQGQYPISNIGDWHNQHAFGDFCGFCHGGDMQAEDKAAAHHGVTASPLADVNASCAACHPDDCSGRAERYAAILGVTPGRGAGTSSRQQQAPFVEVSPRIAGPVLQEPATPSEPAQPAIPPAPPEANWGNTIAALLAVALLVAGGGYVLWNERIVRFNLAAVIAYVKKEEWSPYTAGVLLGVVVILVVAASTALHNQAMVLSASAPFQSILGGMAKLAAPDWVARNVYYRGVMTPGLTWGVFLLLGMVIGGALSALSSGAWKLRWMPENQWDKAFGPSRAKRWALVFVGTLVSEIGAGLAGGCTSGLAIWGGWQLAPAAFLFMAGMFASGILTALIVYRGKY